MNGAFIIYTLRPFKRLDLHHFWRPTFLDTSSDISRKKWGIYRIWSSYHPLISVVCRVDASVTSRMGWVRGETYFDTYAPALPKEVYTLPFPISFVRSQRIISRVFLAHTDTNRMRFMILFGVISMSLSNSFNWSVQWLRESMRILLGRLIFPAQQTIGRWSWPCDHIYSR